MAKEKKKELICRILEKGCVTLGLSFIILVYMESD